MPTYTYPGVDNQTIRGVFGRTLATASTAQPDLSGEEDRYINNVLGEGAWTWLQANAYQVTPQSGMIVRVGSGNAKTDYLTIKGTVAGQGTYILRHEPTYSSVTLNAQDTSSTRVDRIYQVVLDSLYDSNAGGIRAPRLAYARGDLGGALPGPDAAWKAYRSLARITIRPTSQGGGTVLTSDIVQEAGVASLAVTDFSALSVAGSGVWTAANDGSGSGLDADTLDSYHASSFVRWDAYEVPAIIGGTPPAGTILRRKLSRPVVVTGNVGAFNAAFQGGAFPNGLLDVNLTLADNASDVGGIMPVYGNHTLSTAHGQAFLRGGTFPTVGTPVRVRLEAIGW